MIDGPHTTEHFYVPCASLVCLDAFTHLTWPSASTRQTVFLPHFTEAEAGRRGAEQTPCHTDWLPRLLRIGSTGGRSSWGDAGPPHARGGIQVSRPRLGEVKGRWGQWVRINTVWDSAGWRAEKRHPGSSTLICLPRKVFSFKCKALSPPCFLTEERRRVIPSVDPAPV